MKALVCAECTDIRALDPSGEWVACRCGNVQARWVDARAGVAEFKAHVRRKAFVLGLHNGMLTAELRGETDDWEDVRALHDVVTNQPGYVFDKGRAGCWAVLLKVGASNDVMWAVEEEPNVVGKIRG